MAWTRWLGRGMGHGDGDEWGRSSAGSLAIRVEEGSDLTEGRRLQERFVFGKTLKIKGEGGVLYIQHCREKRYDSCWPEEH